MNLVGKYNYLLLNNILRKNLYLKNHYLYQCVVLKFIMNDNDDDDDDFMTGVKEPQYQRSIIDGIVKEYHKIDVL